MSNGFDRVILSTDENSKYIQYWDFTPRAWRKFFPGCKVSLALVSKNPNPRMLRDMASDYDDICIFDPAKLPSANVAKVARYWLASHYPEDVCLIHDMDTVPLQSRYTVNLLTQRKEGHLLCVGREVYDGTPHKGKFPAGHMTGEGYLFADMMEGYEPGEEVADHKENIASLADIFSDESLVRAQLQVNDSIPVQHVVRGLDIKTDWVDRSWWSVDVDKLQRGGYVECNMLRPWSDHMEEMRPIVEYIKKP